MLVSYVLCNSPDFIVNNFLIYEIFGVNADSSHASITHHPPQDEAEKIVTTAARQATTEIPAGNGQGSLESFRHQPLHVQLGHVNPSYQRQVQQYKDEKETVRGFTTDILQGSTQGSVAFWVAVSTDRLAAVFTEEGRSSIQIPRHKVPAEGWRLAVQINTTDVPAVLICWRLEAEHENSKVGRVPHSEQELHRQHTHTQGPVRAKLLLQFTCTQNLPQHRDHLQEQIITIYEAKDTAYQFSAVLRTGEED